MSAVFCKLQRLLPSGGRPRPLLARPQAADSGWSCLELAGQPVTTSLEAVRELVVHDPAALTAEVLAAAPDLLAVVLPEHCRLPAPIAAELGRRQIATVWRLPGLLAVSGREQPPQAGSGEAGTRGAGSVSRRGNQP